MAAVAKKLDSGGQIFIREPLPDFDKQALRFRLACIADNRIEPRMIRVGQLLSLTGIDELPQLINVLQGAHAQV